MTRADIGHLALAICLTGTAGYVDAVGFLKLGHLFVSFMSGNSTQFAVAASHGELSKAAEAGGIVVLFLVGVVVGHLWAVWAKDWRRPAVLIVDAALLGLAALLASSHAVVVPIVLAMGLQNEALHKAGEVKTNLTYVTGTLVSLGENIAGALGGEPKKRWLWAPYLLLCIGLVIGAVIGARVYGAMAVRALAWPAALLVLFAALTAVLVWLGISGEKTAE
jgi:uncharacterized membrane protein YoaK (UPF0700 family)